MRHDEQAGQFLLPPWLSACTLECNPGNEMVAFLHFWVGGGILTVVCAYCPNSSSAYPPSLESLEGILESAPFQDSLVPLGDFNGSTGSELSANHHLMVSWFWRRGMMPARPSQQTLTKCLGLPGTPDRVSCQKDLQFPPPGELETCPGVGGRQ